VPARRTYNPAVIAVCCFALAATVILVVVFAYLRMHPHVTVRDPETGKIVFSGRTTPEEADAIRAKYEERRREERLMRQGRGRPGASDPTFGPDPAGLVDQAPPGPSPGDDPATEVSGDPKLLVGEHTFASAATGTEDRIACGRVRSRYEVALGTLTVEARAGAQLLGRQTFAYVPAGEAIRYSIAVPPSVGEEDLKIVATGVPAPEDLMVWHVRPDAATRRTLPDGTVIWRGRTRNPAGVPVKDVKVYLDFYDSDGVWGGAEQGGLDGERTIGVGKTGFFRVASKALSADTAGVWIVRVVARKY
jgi:hypothetical protein